MPLVDDAVELFQVVIIILVLGYVLLAVVDALFINVPFV